MRKLGFSLCTFVGYGWLFLMMVWTLLFFIGLWLSYDEPFEVMSVYGWMGLLVLYVPGIILLRLRRKLKDDRETCERPI